ncbi:thiamine-phosphate kinase [Actinokineospora alba]|uniref:Thiamine-monophosphate kinase n=1 Tax=Actinokineospora alba TaxID=504798 RepID=A0A1H0I160_9PSEU|nr:thiamine-phosphate kinase [Actinokineospora alba]TDP64654.1 thiamine-phosphate kinase [Actinokineospora alba]SDI84858.1 thiamine-monophosphate kinase [Actinokineospora alba]SDO25114.1 thiamine-phosphate kinase [Actinokineospora alba]
MRPDSTQGQETVADVGEFGLIRRITEGRKQGIPTLLGPGDDAAVVAAVDGRVVASTDVLVEGVHFRFDWSPPDQVGRKAIAVNLADIAAMGAVPTAVLVGLACPSTTPVSVIDELSAGMWHEAGRARIGIIGGDMANSDTMVISVTALGDLEGRMPITRGGAMPGDIVAVAGRLGWSAAGLAVLGRGFRSPVTVVGAHRAPEPPYAAGPQAADCGATAMIDVSDGLLADLGHIGVASNVAIDVRTDLIEVHQRLIDVAQALGADPRHWVLTGGEDHALAATFPDPGAIPEGWRAIGTVTRGSGVTVDGSTYEGAAGWQHWR